MYARKLLVLLATAIGLAVLAPAAQAAFPGRNGDIAYVAPGAGQDGGPGEIWTVNPSSGATTQLTNLFAVGDPAWSDDGRTVAFSEFIGRQGNAIGAVPWRRPTAGPWQLDDVEFMTGPAPPTGPDDVGTAEDFYPAWAPGGRRIAYVDITESLVVLGADDSKRVIATGANADGPAWSPDGRLIAFTRCTGRGSGCAIWTVRPNGTHLRRLTDGTMNEQNPSWSPNGRRLVFEADGGLWTIRRRAYGRRPRPRPLVDSGLGPSWSPDGKQIAFGGADGVYVVNADGSDARRVVATPDAAVRQTDWQPKVWPMRGREVLD
jgi:Tol biopolymer transport system component